MKRPENEEGERATGAGRAGPSGSFALFIFRTLHIYY